MMALKTFNPTTPSQRHLVIVDRTHDDALARRRA